MAIGLTAWLVAWGCGSPRGAPDTEIDLADELEYASPRHETSVVDASSMVDGSRVLTAWGKIRGEEDRRPHVVVEGERAVLPFTVMALRDKEVSFRCSGVSERPGRPMASLRVNGMYVGSVALNREATDHRERIPARALRLGDNLLELRFRRQERGGKTVPAVAGEGMSVVCRSVVFSPASAVSPVGIEGDGDRKILKVPYLGGIEYFLMATPGSELVIDDVETWGEEAEAPALRVVFRFDEGPPSRVVDIPVDGSESPLSLAVPSKDGRPVGISLLALTGGSGTAATAGLRLVSPRLRRPPAAGSEAKSRSSGDSAILERPSLGGDPHIVVYLIDTLRADHLGGYGYDRPVSPEIDELAEEGVLFRRALAPSSWTKSSVASLFTGMIPQRHGVEDREDLMPYAGPNLPEILRVAGYETAGFVTNSTVSHDFRFDLGFHRYVLLGERPTREVHRLSDELNERVFRWLDGRDTPRPFFAYVHATDPHEPYTPRDPFRQRFASDVVDPGINKGVRVREALAANPDFDLERARRDMIHLYDAEIAFNDDSFGTLVDRLRRDDIWDSSLVILLSDHGEEFLDHGGWSHGATLYREVLRVPLIIKFPGGWGAGRVVDERVSLVDLLPTILDVLRIDAPNGVEGQSLLPTVRDVRDEEAPTVLGHLGLGHHRQESLIRGRWKLIRRRDGEGRLQRLELFDLETDPLEHRNVVSERPVTSGFLMSLLDKEVRRGPDLQRAEELVLDDELRDRLRALGYLQ